MAKFFGERADVARSVFFHLFSGLKVNTRVFQGISMCTISFSVTFPFSWNLCKAFKS